MSRRSNVFASANHPVSAHLLRIAQDFPDGPSLPWRSERSFTMNSLKKDSLGRRIIRGMATTDTLNRDNAVMAPEGAVVEWFKRNPAFLANHHEVFMDGTPGRIGTVIELTRKRNGIGFAAREAPSNPLAAVYFNMAEDGDLNAVSIGWIPIEWERFATIVNGRNAGAMRFTKWEFIELSLLSGVPKAPDALLESVKRSGMTVEEAVAHGLPVRAVNEALVAQNKAPMSAADVADVARHFHRRMGDAVRSLNGLQFAVHALGAGRLMAQSVVNERKASLSTEAWPDAHAPADAAGLVAQVDEAFDAVVSDVEYAANECEIMRYRGLFAGDGEQRSGRAANATHGRGESRRSGRAAKALAALADRLERGGDATGDAA